ncbi:hypothetical protein CVT24_005508 [Panaeolus cyanescens]|uniref:F-box domain-containing protein n=1 Tax=Panaeolus cyanescens TaxID=181874 RepID=A0A409YBZ9_9AGAR|nr:hypothetical protein CVT24_005508 [Panaeolus cyanescens]
MPRSNSIHRNNARPHVSNSHPIQNGNQAHNATTSQQSGTPNASTAPAPPDSLFAFNASSDEQMRRQFLNSVVTGCTHSELIYLSNIISPLLKRDFLTELPPEIGYYILSFLEEPKTLMRASLVSKNWMRLIRDETLWRRMCAVWGFENWEEGRMDFIRKIQGKADKLKEREKGAKMKGKEVEMDGEGESEDAREPVVYKFSYRRHFRTNYIIKQNWLSGGRLLQIHKIRSSVPSGDETVTSLAMDEDWIVVGLSSSRIKVYSTVTGVLCRTLVGHESGVWGVCLVMKGGWMANPGTPTTAERTASNELQTPGQNFHASLGLGSKDTFFLHPEPPQPVLSTGPDHERVPMTSKGASNPGKSAMNKTKKKKKKPTKFKLPKAAVASAKIRGVDIEPPFPPSSSSSHAHFSNSTSPSHPHSSSSYSRTHLKSGANGMQNHPSDGMHIMPSESHDTLLSPLLRLALGLDPLEDASSSDSCSQQSDGDENDMRGVTGDSEEADGAGSDEAVVAGSGRGRKKRKKGKRNDSPGDQGGSDSTGASSCAEAGSVRGADDFGGDDVVGLSDQGVVSHSQALDEPDLNSSAEGQQFPQAKRVHRHEQGAHREQTKSHARPPPPPPFQFQMLPDDLATDKPTVDPKLCMASVGWGQPNSIIVSGGCDKVVRVWEARSGLCIYVLHGHTSTIRSLRVLDNRPIAITGSRDSTLRVWDIQKGKCLHVLEGHEASVRCLDVSGNIVVSGSYDTTCRVWNVDTGECIHVLRGHFSQIYSVAFDGVRIASGGLDTTVRIWDVESGHCTALLQGHSTMVCALQLSPSLLVTGAADGRVITFSLSTYTRLHTISAHDSSVTSLQFCEFPPSFSSGITNNSSAPVSSSPPAIINTISSTSPLSNSSTNNMATPFGFLVTGGNDGRARLWNIQTGELIRELTVRNAAVLTLLRVLPPHSGNVPHPTPSGLSISADEQIIASIVGPGPSGLTKYQVEDILTDVIVYLPGTTYTITDPDLDIGSHTYNIEQGGKTLRENWIQTYSTQTAPFPTGHSGDSVDYQGTENDFECVLDDADANGQHHTGVCTGFKLNVHLSPTTISGSAVLATSTETVMTTFTGTALPIAIVTVNAAQTTPSLTGFSISLMVLLALVPLLVPFGAILLG